MNKLGIVVPYRNREEHLAEFIPHMEEFLGDVEYEIIIAEQSPEKTFNRGMMKNLGFLQLDDSFDRVCFHDIDMLPLRSDYSLPKVPKLLADEVEVFGWKRPYPRFFGGVVLFPKETFELVNGYCNDYWGWGAEDDDLRLRCLSHKIITKVRNGRYKSLDHETEGDTGHTKKPSPETLENRKIFRTKNVNNVCDVGLRDLTPKILKSERLAKNVVKVTFEVV